jgi:excisionase family DNA binding protein
METTEQPLLLSVNETAHLIGQGTSKTWELVASGRIFSVREGKRRLVPRESIEKYVAELIAEQAA